MNVKQVAEYYSVTEQTVRNWVKQGLPYKKHYKGKRYSLEFELEEVKLWLDARDKII